MKQSKIIVSYGLAAILTFSCVIPAAAKPDIPPYDETLYVTLDHYGEIRESSIVKGYQLNGSSEITDYGAYDKITNMTDYTEPQIHEDGSITFQTDSRDGRFYFEGQTSVTKQQLPWDIRVGYRLNGVDKKAEELAGASGLVEINIDLIPNTLALDYYKNNMVLSAATAVDMDKNLSLEAEGAQVQSMGSLNAVAFFALPGEEQHYTIKIGTEDFTFTGIVFMMVPLKVGQMDKINDLRDAKETIEDSADAVNNSLDVILNTLNGMQAGIRGTADGLKGLDQTRQIIAGTKGRVYEDADAALASLNDLSAGLKPFTSHTKEAQNALNQINSNLNGMVATLDDLSPQLGDLRDNIRSLRDDMDSLKSLLNSQQAASASKQLEKLLQDIYQDLSHMKEAQGSLNVGLEQLAAIYKQLNTNTRNLKSYSSFITEDIDEDEINKLANALDEEGIDNAEDLANYLNKYYNGEYGPAEIDELISFLSDSVGVTGNTGNLASPSSALPPNVQAALGKILYGTAGTVGNSGLTDDAINLIRQTEAFLTLLNSQKSILNGSVESLRDLGTTAGKICTTADDLISSVDELNNTVNRYHGEAISTLQDAGVLAQTAAKSVDSLYVFFTSLENQLKTAGNSLNSGTQKTLNGLTDVLEQAYSGLAQTGTVQDAKDTIRQLVEDKWDEYTGEYSTILNADPQSSPVSFTSEKNPSPKTIQIILRTGEITVDEDDTAIDVDEDFHADGSILHRIANIFRAIWNAITSIFE